MIPRWLQKCLLLAAMFIPASAWAVDAPVFVPEDAMVVNGFNVTITTTSTGATIHYTVNGQTPTENDSTVASGGTVFVGQNLTLKARAWLGGTPSAVTSADYWVTGLITAGDAHVLAIKSNGQIKSWGQRDSGRLGNGSTTSGVISSPVQVLKTGSTSFLNAVTAAAGTQHSVVVDSSGLLWTFGKNNTGQIGDGTGNQTAYAVQVVKSLTPGDYLTDIMAVAAGVDFSLAVGEDGKVWAWGAQDAGNLGNGLTNSATVKIATPVTTSGTGNPQLSGIVQVAAGKQFSLARASDGTGWSWGNNSKGQLGIGNTTNQYRAVQIKKDASNLLTGIEDIATGTAHTLAVVTTGTLNGSVWAWGDQAGGALGNGQTSNGSITYPVQVQKTGGGNLDNIVRVAAGVSAHSLALDGSGYVWSWGKNGDGQLGDGSTTNRGTADRVKVSGSTYLTNVVDISAGNGYSIALKADGSIYAWGDNTSGDFGNGGTTDSNYAVAGGTSFILANAAPTVTLTITGSLLAPATLSLSASASDADGSLAQVKFFDGASLLFSDSASPYQYSATAIASGTHVFRAVAIDNEGGTAEDNETLTVISSTLAAPTLSLPAATYSGTQYVVVSATSGASIYYTTDGSAPTTSSTLYTGSIAIVSTTTLSAIAAQTGYVTSPATTAVYTIDAASSAVSRSGLVLWLKGDAGVTASGSSVGAWADQSGNGLSAVQSSGTSKPVLLSNQLNGKPTLSFDGTNDYLTVSDTTSLRPAQLTIFVVGKHSSGGTSAIVLAKSGSTSWTDGYGLVREGTSNAFGFFVNNNATTKASGTIPAGDYFVSRSTYDLTKLKSYANGTPLTAFSSTAAINNSTQPLLIGGNGSPTYSLGGEISEVLVYNRALSASEQLAVESYLSGRYAIANADSNFDGLPDWWEDLYFDGVAQDPNADADGDGLTNLQEYEGNSNPRDYYSQGGGLIAPALSIVSGNGQSGEPLSFAAQPLVVQVNSGTIPLSHAPLVFTVLGTGGGKIASTNSGTGLVSSLDVTSGANGRGQVYFQFSATSVTSGTIQVTAGTGTNAVSTTFTATSTVAGGSGLLLWLKADAGVSVSGSNVTSWADQTANHNDVAQASSGNQPVFVSGTLGGQPVIRFSGTGQYFTGTTSSGFKPTNITVLAVYRLKAYGTNPKIIAQSYAASGWNPPWISWTLGAGGDGDGKMRSEVAVGSYKVLSDFEAQNLDQAYLATATYNGSSQKIFANGQLRNTAYFSGTIQYGNSTVFHVGSDPNGEYLNGDIAEVLVFDQALSDSARKNVEVYLADKYGLYHADASWILEYPRAVQAEIHRARLSKEQADKYAAFYANNSSPSIPLPGVSLWFKADTGVVTSGSQVTTWEDQGPNGLDAQQSSSGAQPLLVSGTLNAQPVLRFNGTSQYFTGTSAPEIRSANVTMLAVFRMSNAAWWPKIIDHPYNAVGWDIPYVGWALGGGPDTTGKVHSDVGAGGQWNALSSTSAATLNTPYVAASRYDGAHRLYVNGAFQQESNPDGPIKYGTGRKFHIGNDPQGEYWQGDIAEILIYSRALSTAELAQAQAYLAQKYGVTVSPWAPGIFPYGGVYETSVEVTLGPIPPSAEIRYTLDGTEPNASSPLYEEPFALDHSAPLKAAFFVDGHQDGPVNSAQFYVADTDQIGISDAWQIEYFGHIGIDPDDDPMGSGLSNLQKYLLGYDPTKYSTNGSGLSDAQNYQLGYAPDNLDIDGDGISNADELAAGLSPFLPDSDRDGVDDGADAYPLDPTRSTAPAADPDDHTAPTIILTKPPGATLVNP